MKAYHLLQQVLALPVDTLAFFPGPIATQLAKAENEEVSRAQSKEHAAAVGSLFSDEINQLTRSVLRGPKPRFDDKILDYIRANPNCSGTKLRNDLGVGQAIFNDATRRLREQNKLIKHGERIHTTWSATTEKKPGMTRLPLPSVEKATLSKGGRPLGGKYDAKVISYLGKNPKASSATICKLLGMPKGTFISMSARLRTQGVIALTGFGPGATWSLASK